ncbi:hypothetical protein V6N13_011651 [Hibiscus sabdariffa]|uniref:Uncharacterized protein n=1 Tax=Hibiscus sabdariffa TaxID=183260 RepID=A0ABR2SD36_9ROSI
MHSNGRWGGVLNVDESSLSGGDTFEYGVSMISWISSHQTFLLQHNKSLSAKNPILPFPIQHKMIKIEVTYLDPRRLWEQNCEAEMYFESCKLQGNLRVERIKGRRLEKEASSISSKRLTKADHYKYLTCKKFTHKRKVQAVVVRDETDCPLFG